MQIVTCRFAAGTGEQAITKVVDAAKADKISLYFEYPHDPATRKTGKVTVAAFSFSEAKKAEQFRKKAAAVDGVEVLPQ